MDLFDLFICFAINFSKPNVPGYTGSTHHFKTTQVSHYDSQGRPYTTYAAYHRELPVLEKSKTQIASLTGDFGLLQTKVVPGNPFNQIENKADKAVNNSLDNVQQPIIITKSISHSDFFAGKREAELKGTQSLQN